jgi:hypothetical protein
MPGRSRKPSGTGIYHAVLRGNEKRIPSVMGKKVLAHLVLMEISVIIKNTLALLLEYF